MLRSGLVFLVAATLLAGPANFNVSHYSMLEVYPRSVKLIYILELGEVPTYNLLKAWGLSADAPQAALDARVIDQARNWGNGLEIRSGGTGATANLLGASIRLRNSPDGQASARVETKWDVPGARSPFTFEDHNFPDRAGWKEIVIRAAEGVKLLQASQDGQDRSNALLTYSDIAVPQDLRASVEWAPGARETSGVRIVPVPQPTPVSFVNPAPQSPLPAKSNGFLARLLEMKQIPLSWMPLGLAAAIALGGAHALTPGHGKTIVAAYLVGSRGTLRHAALLGGMVTFTHTISVFILGFAALFFAGYFNQEKVTRVLEVASGLGIAVVGATMLYKRVTLLRHLRQHHGGDAPGHDDVHVHGPGGHSHAIEGEVSLESLIALGASGGMVPCPDALILLLFAISVGHIGAGLFLLLGFSAGLAGVLIGIGILVLYAKRWLPESYSAGHPLFRFVPVFSAVVVICLGLWMTAISLGGAGFRL